MIDPRIYNTLETLEVELNEMALSVRISGLSARRERLTRQEVSIRLEALADRVEKLSAVLEQKYGREVPID